MIFKQNKPQPWIVLRGGAHIKCKLDAGMREMIWGGGDDTERKGEGTGEGEKVRERGKRYR